MAKRVRKGAQKHKVNYLLDPNDLKERPCLGIGCTKIILTDRRHRFCRLCSRRKRVRKEGKMPNARSIIDLNDSLSDVIGLSGYREKEA